jgi:hypothetical protein
MILGRGYMGSKNYQLARETFNQASQVVNDGKKNVFFKLKYNSIFVTLPPCH